MKKIIAIILTLMLVMSALSVAAFAGGEPTSETVGYSSSRVVAVDLADVPNILDYMYVESPVFKITGASGMEYLSTLAGYGEDYKDITLYLANDIDMSGVEYSPVNFYGVFDGQGHVIDNLTVNTATGGGLFSRVQNCVIKNIIIGENCTFTYDDEGNCDEATGIIAKDMNGQEATITNCYVLGDVVGGQYVGGLVGCINGGTVTDCTFYGSVLSNHDKGAVGGIAGDAATRSDSSIRNCRNAGSVTATGTNVGKAVAGGIIGRMLTFNCDAVTVSGCINNGQITSKLEAGGIMGYVAKSGIVIENCKNYGSLTSETNSTGIAGGVAAEATGYTNTNNENLIGETDTTYDLEQVVFDPPATDPYVPGEYDDEGGDDLFGGSDDDSGEDTTEDTAEDTTEDTKKPEETTAGSETTTDSETTSEESSGCGSTIGAAMGVLVCAGLAVAAAKKKKD